MISAIYVVPPTSGPLQAYCWTAKECVCVCVSVFLTRRVMYVKRVAQGYLQTPPPPTPGQDQWLLSQAMFFDKRVRVSSDR